MDLRPTISLPQGIALLVRTLLVMCVLAVFSLSGAEAQTPDSTFSTSAKGDTLSPSGKRSLRTPADSTFSHSKRRHRRGASSAAKLSTPELDSLGITFDSLSTLRVLPLSANAITDVVQYKAEDSVAFNIADRHAFLYRQGDVQYQGMVLKADAIAMDFNRQEMDARCVPDSNGKLQGRPFFKQGDAEYIADTIRFNYSSKRGIISSVVTQEGDGYLHGTKVKRVNDSVMYLNSGMYTTCNYNHPHFALNFTKSKMITGDKMITGPAYITLADVPLPIAVPFAFFPLTHGRASGILMPSYGWMDRRGYYLKNGGYYLAINDYVDLSLLGELYTNLSWAAEARSNYFRRYHYSGNIDVRYGITTEGLRGDPNTYNSFNDFKVSWHHTQDPKANPVSRFSADVNLQSRNYNKNTTNRNDYFSSTTTSSIAFSTTLADIFNLSASVRESYNVQTAIINLQLPSFSLNTKTIYPFRSSSSTGSYKWYEKISMTYTLSAQNSLTTPDSLLFTSASIDNMRYGVSHAIPISSTVKVLNVFNWTNSLTYNERWHWRTIEKEYDPATGALTIDTIRGFRANRDLSFSSSLSTRIYGMFNFKWGFVKALRHVINPSLSFNFRPDFGANWMGFWKGYTDTTGYTHRYSIFEQSLYGGPADGRSGQVRLSVGNNLEIKVAGKDTADAPRKITLIENLTFSTGYDLAKDSLQWSDLTISGRTTLFKMLVLSYNATLCPYVIDEQGRKHNQFLYRQPDRQLFRRENNNYSAQISYSLNQNTFAKGDNAHKTKPQGHAVTPILMSPYNDNPALFMGSYVDFSVPWNLALNYSVNYVNRYVASAYNYDHTFTQTLSLSGNVSLTPQWKVAFSSGYDFVNHGFSYTSVDIYRDLHCWEMRFNWVPFGYYKSWNFIINIKAPSLKDVKYEKQHSYLDNASYYTY